MNEYIYAQLNEDNVCVAIMQLSSECIASNMIKVDSLDYDKLNRKYENEIWGEKILCFNSSDDNIDNSIPMPYQPTNAEIAQLLTDLYSELIIAGVI